MLKKHPKPDTDAANTPNLTALFLILQGRNYGILKLARIQVAMLYAANPLAGLWSDLIVQGLTQDPQDVIYMKDVLEVMQLLGNANHLISESRRENVVESIHPSLEKYSKGDFSKAKGDLFSEEFKDTLVKKVEADSALSKVVNIVTKLSNTSSQVYQKQTTGNRFFGGWTSRYGAASGRVYQPYKNQSKGKHTPGKPYFRKGSVLDRLGSTQSERGHHQTSGRQQRKSAPTCLKQEVEKI